MLALSESIFLLSSMVSNASFLVSYGRPVILYTLNLIPYLCGNLSALMISWFFHLLSRIFLLNSSLPCSTPKDILSRPTSAILFKLWSLTVSGLVSIQNGNLISEYISQNSSNSFLFIAKKVSAQKYIYSAPKLFLKRLSSFNTKSILFFLK